MGKKLLAIVNYVTNFFKKQIAEQKEAEERIQAYYREQTAKAQKASLDSRIHQMMQVMTHDLFEAFHSHNYHDLLSISNPSNIRIKDYRYYNGELLYLFSLDKVSSVKIPDWKLISLMENMNTDIKSALYNLNCAYTYNELEYMFPFMTHNMCIKNIQDIGGTNVIITVTTDITP